MRRCKGVWGEDGESPSLDGEGGRGQGIPGLQPHARLHALSPPTAVYVRKEAIKSCADPRDEAEAAPGTMQAASPLRLMAQGPQTLF
ncbi:MAG: hypothetical protein DRN91_07895 [Candidatus Alkanophagales archaeon]|nr:MAG: hypothetical protein DRN91_07895 [Candidatus Alkanophagales archaeon]